MNKKTIINKTIHFRQILLLAAAMLGLVAGAQAQVDRVFPNAFTEKDDFETLAEQYYGSDDIESKYALVEVLKAMGDYDGAEMELRRIWQDCDLTGDGYREYETFSEFFHLAKDMREQGRDWATMTAEERARLRRIAEKGYGRARVTALATMNFHGAAVENGTKQASFGPGDFPWTCRKTIVDTTLCPPIFSDELKIVFMPSNSTCACSGDTVFVQGRYTPQPNEYPEDAPTQMYSNGGYSGVFNFEIHYSDPDLNDFGLGSERCLTDKQCEEINLQITCESDFAIGKHHAPHCAETITVVDGHQVHNNADDTLGAFIVIQRPELETPNHDHGDGTVTISWTGFDGTPRQHVLYFIMDDHFYIDYVGLEEDENEHVSASVLGVYPNPTDGTFTIEADDIKTVEVFNQLGQKVLADHSGSRTINAGGLPAGIYFLKVETATATKYGKLMKR